jgi:2'-5' RNA ligase
VQYAFEFLGDGASSLWRPERQERLFFGVRPDAKSADRVAQFAERFIADLGLKERRLERECLHISLRHVSDDRRLRTQTIYAAGQAAKAVSMSPFEIKLHFIKSFAPAPSSNGRPRKRPLVLLAEADALFDIHRALGAAMKKNGMKTRDGFAPHMTLSFGSKPIAMQAIEPIRLTVDEFVLVHSELGLTRHHTIDRWPLRASVLADVARCSLHARRAETMLSTADAIPEHVAN